MRYFGLVEDVEVGDTKQVKLSDRAYRILKDSPDSPERKKALSDAALSPKAYAYCWKKFDGETPASMRSHLIFDQHFNDSSVDGFLRDYKETIRYAGLAKDTSAKVMADIEEEEGGDLGENGSGLELLQAEKAILVGKDRKDSAPVEGAKMWNEVFNLPEGAVTIQIPAELSADSFEDLVAGLELFKRKIGRMVARATPAKEGLAPEGEGASGG